MLKIATQPKSAFLPILSLLTIAVSEALLLADVLSEMYYFDFSFLGIDHTTIEMVAVISLAVALLVVGKNVFDVFRQNRRYLTVARVASGDLVKVINTNFDAWGLTDAESEVAMLLIKGFSVQEISDIRDTRPGTVKSQSNAIYRKAGLNGRNDLASFFIEDLLSVAPYTADKGS